MKIKVKDKLHELFAFCLSISAPYLYISLFILLNNLPVFGFNSNTSDNLSYFIENKGQWDESALYLTKLNGLKAWVVKDGLVFDFNKHLPYETSKNEVEQNINPLKDPALSNQTVQGHVVKFSFQNSLINQAKYEGIDKINGYHNYFLGNNPEKWVGYVNLFNSVFIKDLYNGIDVRYYFENNQIRFDLIVNPHANPKEIIIKLEGQNDFTINEDNEIVLKTSLGDVKINQLITYQLIKNQKITIKSSFKKLGNTIIFDFGKYNPNYPLIIDPLIFSTFLGGNGYDEGAGFTLDQNNNMYIVGSTASSNFPTTTGSYMTSYQGGLYDAYITKINSTGSAIIFSTFIGGSDWDYGLDIKVDQNNNSYITGRTVSSNFPISNGAFQTNLNSTDDSYILKLDSSGSNLLYSTYIGGNSTDISNHLDIDPNGYAYITGWTTSSNYPTTSYAFSTSYNGNVDAFVSKINQNGTGLIFSTYLGSSDIDCGLDLAVDQSGYTYVVGYTYSSSFPTTSGAMQTSYGGGTYDAFITKFDTNGTALAYSTFLGSSGNEICYDVTITSSSEVVVIGSTSGSFPSATSGAAQTTYGGGTLDGFICQLNSSCSAIVYASFLGGSGSDDPRGVVIDSSGNKIISGMTSSTDYPVTSCAYDTSNSGNTDAFITKLNSSLSSFVFSTYIGGSSTDQILAGISTDNSGNAYVAGRTASSDFPTTSGAYSTSYTGGTLDAFALKLQMSVLSTNAISGSPFCSGDSVSVSYTVSCSYNSGNVFIAQLSDSNGSFTSSINLDSLSSTTSGTINTMIPKNTLHGTGYRIRVIATNPSTTGSDNDSNLIINPLPVANFTVNDSIQCLKGNIFVFTNTSAIGSGSMTYSWNFGDGYTSSQTNTSHSYTTANNFNVKLVATSSNACRDSIIKITYLETSPTADFSINDSIQYIIGNNFVFTNSSSIDTGTMNYWWTFGDGATSADTNPSHVYTTINTFNVKLRATSNLGCSDSVIKRAYVLYGGNHTTGKKPIEDEQFKEIIGFYAEDSTHRSSLASNIVLSGPGTYIVQGVVDGKTYTFTVDSYGKRSYPAVYEFKCPTLNANIKPYIRKMIKAGKNFVLVGDAEYMSTSGIVLIVLDNYGHFSSGTFIHDPDYKYYGNYVYYTTDNNYLVGGYYWDHIYKVYHALAFKLDPNLNILWKKSYVMGSNFKRNKITLLNENDSGYMLIGEYSEFLGGNANMFCITVDSSDGSLIGMPKGFSLGNNFIPQDIIRDNSGYTIAGTIRDQCLEDMCIFSIDLNFDVKSDPPPTVLSSQFEGYEECKSFMQFDDKSYVLAGISTTLSEDGYIHAALVWTDSSLTIKRDIIYGFKCDSFYSLGGSSGAFGIDGPKDTIRKAMMAGFIGDDTYLIKPGLGLDLSDEDDSNYYWCNQIKSYFGGKSVTPCKMFIYPKQSTPNSSTDELEVVLFGYTTGSCNNCSSNCVNSTGVLKPEKDGCSCKKMLKKNPY